MCEGPGFGGGETAIPMESVEATVLDLEGAPVVGIQMLLCGLNICLDPKETDSEGHVTIVAPDPPKNMTAPAFKFGDGFEYAKFAMPLTEAVTVFPTIVTAKLPSFAEGQKLEAGTEVTSGDVTLTLAEGTDIKIDCLFYEDAETHGFRATTIPIADAPPAVDASLGLELLYAVAPVETSFCPAAKVTIPNSAGWDPSAEVEFFVHGVDVGQHYAPYAGWAKMSAGQVSADGLTVSTSPDGGMSVLTVFGVRLKGAN